MAHPLVYITVRYECRSRGSLGAFKAVLFDVLATDAKDAQAQAFTLAQAKYETRMGGDWRYTDGCQDWTGADGGRMPMLLPCQTESLTS